MSIPFRPEAVPSLIRNAVRSLQPNPQRTGSRKADGRRRLRCEQLEERTLFSVSPLPWQEALPAADVIGPPTAMEAAPMAMPTEQESSSFERFGSEEELREFLINEALEQYGHLFGTTSGGLTCYRADIRWDWPTKFSDVRTSATDYHSDTNTQVAGVDEGDLVETDGDYLYVLADGELVIIDAEASDQLGVVSRTDVGDRAFAQFLHGDRLTVLSRWHGPPVPVGGPQSVRLESGIAVTIYDISDRFAPEVVQRTELDGDYVDSRVIGDHLYVVMNNRLRVPMPVYAEGSEETIVDERGRERQQYTYETQEQFIARIQAMPIEDLLPGFTSYDENGEPILSELLSEATDIYRPAEGEFGEYLTSVVTMDMTSDAPGPVASTGVFAGYGDGMYMSGDSLYLWSQPTHQLGEWAFFSRPSGSTTIQKFNLNPETGELELQAVGCVEGQILNQFSVDEHDGYLRVATTDTNQRHNNLFVLQQNGDSLDIVGSIENLAENEDIYSARFMGDRAYIVTFRVIDPLFTVDLSDPTQPTIESELKIPGFSSYLHSINDQYLIGIGRATNESGSQIGHPQVSLFDVSDPTDVSRVDQYTIDTGGRTMRNLFDDHHVVAYYPDEQVLTVSILDDDRKNDLWVFEVDTEEGAITLLNRIEHEDANVLRSVLIGDKLYAISDDKATIHDIYAPETAVAEVAYDSELLVAPQPSESFGRFASEEELREFLINEAMEQYGHLFGTNYRHRLFDPNAPMPFSDTTEDHSDTNTQVAGVDEGDLVETDGDYLYVLANGELAIIDAEASDQLGVVSRTEVGGAFAQFLDGDRLTVLSRWYGEDRSEYLVGPVNGDFTWKTGVAVTVYDISDRSAPEVIQRTDIDGAFVDSRVVDNRLYLVMRAWMNYLRPEFVPGSELIETVHPGGTRTEVPYVSGGSRILVAERGKEQYHVGEYETFEQFVARIQAMPIEELLPSFTSYDANGEVIRTGIVSEASNLHRLPAEEELENIYSIVTLDMHGDEPGLLATTSFCADDDSTSVYMSGDSLYVIDSRHIGTERALPRSALIGTPIGTEEVEQQSIDIARIRKFDIDHDTGQVTLVAEGEVEGKILDQFSVDEHDGYLRVATTVIGSEKHNNLFVLQQNGDALDIIGSIENLAEDEDIYSVRFMDDRAYVVTFEDTTVHPTARDPLFAIDLSDPTQPTVESELKIPGFSNYLHAIGDGYLIGIGRTTNERGTSYDDPQVSLFDVSDPAAVSRVDQYTIETGRTGGFNVFNDHHVVAYYPDEQILTVSIPDPDRWYQNDLWVFKINTEVGAIEFLTQIDHGDSAVMRSVLIGDQLYAISGDKVTVHNISTPETPVAEVAYDSELLVAPEAPVELTPEQVEQRLAVLREQASEAIAAINGFSYQMYEQFMHEEGNLFLSPMSISTALTMAMAGADGETLRQMADVLGLDLNSETLHDSFGALADYINMMGEYADGELALANSLWIQEGFGLEQDYLDLMESVYEGALTDVDYIHDAEAAREQINAWVADQTNDMILDLIPEGMLDENVRFTLVNAMYFKGDWKQPFEKDFTRDEEFTLESGESVVVPTMHQLDTFRYNEIDGFQVLEMQYVGDQQSMIFVLPIEGQAELDDLNAALIGKINTWLDGDTGWQKVSVHLPKFEVEVSAKLGELLQGMGMIDAFNPALSDLSRMADVKGLYIKHVLHKAKIIVDEKGTEAAAATAVIGGVTSVTPMPAPPKVFDANHPFHYFLRDNESGAILFMGRMNDPLQETNLRLEPVFHEPAEAPILEPTPERRRAVPAMPTAPFPAPWLYDLPPTLPGQGSTANAPQARSMAHHLWFACQIWHEQEESRDEDRWEIGPLRLEDAALLEWLQEEL